jgi:Protein of unknown function (DUF2924)
MRSTLSRPRTGRSSGEASANSGQLVDIETEITALEKRDIQELRAEWRKLYRAEPPRRLSRDLILRAIAYRLQERTHGGLGLATERRLNALAEELEAKGAAHFDPATVLKPGTRLVREWHGRTHTVIVAEDGFEFDGQRYRSLTKVATLITGVHWSGPVFFGLRKRPRAALERGHE